MIISFKYVVRDGQECLVYTEDLSTKTNKGGQKHCGVPAKTVTIYPANNVSRCPVRLYKKYIEKLPNTLKYKELYPQCNSLKNIQLCGMSWYPVGINTLSATVKKLALAVGIDVFFTNHSLCHTCASFLYSDQENCPEQVIAEQTGHRSLAIRKYKHTKKDLKCKVSSVLTDGLSVKQNAETSMVSSCSSSSVKLFKNSELKAMYQSQVCISLRFVSVSGLMCKPI